MADQQREPSITGTGQSNTVCDKTNNFGFVPSKDSGQPGLPTSLIRAFAVHSWVAKDLSFLCVDSEGYYQTGHMSMLIQVLAFLKTQIVGLSCIYGSSKIELQGLLFIIVVL